MRVDRPLPPAIPQGCGPNCGIGPIGGVLTEPPFAINGLPRQPPVILIDPDPDWRAACLTQVGHIPSGYTYLAQLLGHDMGSTVPLDDMPYVQRATSPLGAALGPDGARRRYNLIENPLTLETIYGAGPTLLSHLYDPETMLFRLAPGAIQAKVHKSSGGAAIRSFYDERNRDTLMLHEMTVAVMQYHNRAARLLLGLGRTPTVAYAKARGHVVRVWHGILRQDLLPRFVHPDIAALNGTALAPEWQLDETTLLIGLFRSFHALPLSSYFFTGSGPHNLKRLMKRGYGESDAERFWRVGWDQFLGGTDGGPHSGISLSVAKALALPAGLVAALDAATSKQARPLRLKDPEVVAMVARLPGIWPARITADALARDFATAHPRAPRIPDAEALALGPLYQVLMAEAQLHGRAGGFGPLGSAVLRASVEGSIARVVLGEEDPVLATQQKPRTMLDLITLVRS